LQVCGVTIEHSQCVLNFPLYACTRHVQSLSTHLTSYSLVLDFSTLNSFLRDTAQSFTSSFTSSMVRYFAPCTTSFTLYSNSELLISCTTGFPKPSSHHSPSTGKRSSSSSSDESPHCSIISASWSSFSMSSTIPGICLPSSAKPCGYGSIEVTVMNLKHHLARHIWPSKNFILINPISRNMVWL